MESRAFFVKSVVWCLLVTIPPIEAYEIEVLPSSTKPGAPEIPQEFRQAIVEHVESAVAKYKALFPKFDLEGVRFKIIYYNDLAESVLRQSSGRRVKTSTGTIFYANYIRSSQGEYVRDLLLQRIDSQFFRDFIYFPNFDRDFEAYLEWRTRPIFFESVLFHELLHEAMDRSDLRAVFSKRFIRRGSFKRIKAEYNRQSKAVHVQLLKQLHVRLASDGCSSMVSDVYIADEGGINAPRRCWKNEGEYVHENRCCQLIEEFKGETGYAAQSALNAIEREIHLGHRLPYRHPFDAHVFSAVNPDEEKYLEEYVSISGEAAHYPSTGDFYHQDPGSPDVERVLQFWTSEPIMDLLTVKSE